MVKQSQDGFTLVEIMVAISIFVIVATICIGALLTAHRVNQRAQAIKLAMDNLNFALDSISIKMKRGNAYACLNGGVGVTYPGPDGNCSDQGVTFKSEDNQDLYYWLGGVGGADKLMYRKNSETARQIIADNIEISDFSVRVFDSPNPSLPPPSPELRSIPRASISVTGEAQVGQEKVPFSIQTVISARVGK